MTTNPYREALDRAIRNAEARWARMPNAPSARRELDALNTIREAIALDLLAEETLDEVAADLDEDGEGSMTFDHVVREFQGMTKERQREHLREHGIEEIRFGDEDTRRGPSRYYALHVEAHDTVVDLDPYREETK